MPRTPLGRGFLAVDHLRHLLDAHHAFLFQRDWRGKFQLEASSSTRSDDELIGRIMSFLRLPSLHGVCCRDLATRRSRWLLVFPVKTSRGKTVAALAAARDTNWCDADVAAGLGFATALGRNF